MTMHHGASLAIESENRTVSPVQAERDAYYAHIDGSHLTPLWESLHALVPPQPRPQAVPAIWKYRDIRPLVYQAGALISTEEAVRRVLILESPAFVWALQRYLHALRRPAIDSVGRDCAQPSPQPVCPAFHCGRQGRLDGRGRRAHDDAAG